MTILLSSSGFHDPYSSTSIKSGQQAGPVLAVLANQPFDRAVLFQTPNTRPQTEATGEVMSPTLSCVAVQVVALPLKDPADYVSTGRQAPVAR